MDLQRGTAAAAELGGGRHVHQPMLHSTFLDRTASVFVQCSYAFGCSVRRSQTWELPTQSNDPSSCSADDHTNQDIKMEGIVIKMLMIRGDVVARDVEQVGNRVMGGDEAL
jgi:hypothetical protein